MTVDGVGPASVAAVLAGGLGRRLGRPKAAAIFAGEPLITRPLTACSMAGLTPVVIAKPDTPLPALEVDVWTEPEEPRHPLCGIVEALRRASAPVLVCGCDMPFLEPDLLASIAGQSGPLAVARAGGRLQPLLGVYDPLLLAPLEAALADGRSLTETVTDLDATEIDDAALRRFGDPARMLFNVNTEADLHGAELMLAAP